MPVAEVRTGDCIEVNPGEAIAVDGVVREGTGYVSEAAVSGEPFAVVRRPGDRVLDIVAFECEQVQPVPTVVRNGRTEFLSGLITVEAGMIAMIDLNHLLDDRYEAQAA